jgi:dTDP-4-amino-4,6-dideoxygalactose transaminase
LSLPMGPDLSDSDMDRVIDAVANATSETRAGCGT